MATVQLTNPITIAGTTYSTAQVIVVSPQRTQVKTILPKQEPTVQGCTDQKVKMDCPKRRIHFSKKALNHPRPQSVTRRNTRERNRVRAVNQGFVTLANHVPTHLRSKKMSKVDTLKAAIVYIQELKQVLNNEASEETDNQSPYDTDSLASLTDSTSSPHLDYSDNLFFGENMPTSDSYSESHSSPGSSMSASPSYYPVVPPYSQPSQTVFSPHTGLSQQYSTNFQYPAQPCQWSCTDELPVCGDYQQNAYRQSWVPASKEFYPSDDTEEENILDMVSLMF